MSKKIISRENLSDRIKLRFLIDIRGISLIESLVTLALLSIISVTLASIYSSTIIQAKKIVNNGLCDQHNEKIYTKLLGQKIKPTESSSFVKPTYTAQTYLGAGIANYMTLSAADKILLKPRFDFFGLADGRLYEKVPGAPPVVELAFMKNNGLISYMPLLANNHMGYLADLYIAGFTKAAGFQNLPAAIQTPLALALNQKNKVTSKIQVELYNRETQADVADEALFWPIPSTQYREPGPVIAKYFPYSKNQIIMAKFPAWIKDELGYKVTLQSKITFANSEVETCETTRYFSYSPDLQNVINYSDFDAVKHLGGTTIFDPKKIKDVTVFSSNKGDKIVSDLDPIAPVFINYNAATPADGRNRNLCTQSNQNITDLYIKFRVNNVDLDSGIIPLCIDNSVQWLANELKNGAAGWCTDKYFTPPGGGDSRMPLLYDWKPGSTGWVPCEYLTFCGETPKKVEIIPSNFDKTLEYRFYYDVTFNSLQNRLWGCELKYMAAAVDVAGNLSYPPAKKIDLSALTAVQKTALVSKLNPDVVREINPKIYFKPPPCYTCSCKKCKRGSGGFLGGIFALFLLIVLVIVTGGAALIALPGLVTAGAGLLSVVCLTGGLGCQTGSTASEPALTGAGSGYTSCKSVNNGCKCGFTCNKKTPPGPRWSDSLQAGVDPATYTSTLVANSCQFSTFIKALTPVPTTVNLKFGYKTTLPGMVDLAQYEKVPNSTDMYYVKYDLDDLGAPVLRTVTSGDEIIWQSFNKTTGVFCTSRYRCTLGVWAPSTEAFSYDPTPYNDINDTTAGVGNAEGCYNVKTAYKINWADYGGGLKPLKGPSLCLEVDFNKGVFNETGDILRGTSNYSYYPGSAYGCGADSGLEANPPNTLIAGERIVGMKVADDKCAEPIEYMTGAGPQLLKIALPEAIYDITYNPDGSTTSVFKCWKQCVPPANMPEFSNGNNDQRYYENYTPATDNALPFCTLDRTNFDEIQ